MEAFIYICYIYIVRVEHPMYNVHRLYVDRAYDNAAPYERLTPLTYRY